MRLQIGELPNKWSRLCRVCIDEIEDVVEEEEDELTQSARLSLNEETSPSKPQVRFFLHAITLSHRMSCILSLREVTSAWIGDDGTVVTPVVCNNKQ